MADGGIDPIWFGQNEEDGGETPPVDPFSITWEDGDSIDWENGQPILLELDESVESLAFTMEDGQAILTETGEQLLMEAA